jgi:hypothetical protein
MTTWQYMEYLRTGKVPELEMPLWAKLIFYIPAAGLFFFVLFFLSLLS